MMRDRHSRQAQTKAHQLELWGSFPPRADNQDDPFSTPGAPNGVLGRMGNGDGENVPKLIRLGLTLRDLASRVGPGDYDAHRK